MSETFAWAIHYDDGKKHPLQPGGISQGLVVMGITKAACRVILAQFKEAIDLTKCTYGAVYQGEFFADTRDDFEPNNSNETD